MSRAPNVAEVADVAIVGGGIVGCAVAREAARRGLRVALVEPGPVGGGATAAAMGHLVVLDDDPHELALCRRSLALWRELAPRPEVELIPAGTLWIAADDAEVAAAHDKLARLRAAGVDAAWLDERALADAEPALRPGLCGAVRVPGDAVVYPPGAARALWGDAAALGARWLVGRAAAFRGGEVALADGGVLAASAIVLACGVATAALVAGLPVVPRKGHLVVTERYPGLVHHQLIELGYAASAHATDGGDAVAMNVQPRPTGQLVLGSSRQYTDDAAIDLAIVDAMVARALAYLPGLARLLALRVWAGFRPASRDGRPFIGPCPGQPRVWLATGHEGLGITTSLATAELVVDQILGEPSALDAAPYAPSRGLACA